MAVSTMGNSQGAVARYCRFIARHAGLVLGLGALLFVGAVLLASRLELRTSFSELLPSNDPGVVTMNRTSQRIGDMSLLLVGIRSPDRAANIRYAELITSKLRQLPPTVVSLATYDVRDLRDFFLRNKWLYISEDDLTTIRDELRLEIGKRKNPLMLDLDEGDSTVSELRERLRKQDPLQGRFADGVLGDKDGRYLWVAAMPPGGMFGERAGEKLYQAARQAIAENDPRAFHPQMEAYVSGPVASLLANRQAVERDILWVTVTCLVVVAISILIFFRRWRTVPMIGVSAVLGTVMAFAVAELAFGYVNSSTAFLGSIILGNGINYAIILMSRYQEERSRGQDLEPALQRTLQNVVGGTGIAALCASAAYASLMLTSFRGFYQFGVMGAVGVLFCWLGTFTLMPAMIIVGDRRAHSAGSRRAPLSLVPLGRLIARRPGWLLLGSALVTIFFAVNVRHFTADPFEYDFRKLNVRVPQTEAVQQFHHSQDSLFGRWPQPTIILADDPSQLGPIRQAIDRQDREVPGPRVIGHVVTVFDVLPGTAEVQRRKLDLIDQIRKLKSDKALELASAGERERLAQIDPPADLLVLAPGDLPALARRPFTEVNGTIGNVVLVYPVEKGISIYDGRVLLRIAQVLQRLPLRDPTGKDLGTLETSGSAVVFAAMIRSILDDAPRVTAASLASVVVLILLVMRPVALSAAAISTMLLGVLWMVGGAGLAEVKVTFVNFIALPITFGIGAEYATNVVSRYRETGDIVSAVVSTGSAVTLCSWTTIVGYGSLLAAQNRALQGFGAMAILGEVACLLAAIVAMPALMVWRQQR
jgi:uncharacterized protein